MELRTVIPDNAKKPGGDPANEYRLMIAYQDAEGQSRNPYIMH